MKRRTLKFAVCAAVMAITLSVTACGGSDSGAKTTDTTEVEDTADEKDASSPEAEEEKTEVKDESDAESENEEESEEVADSEEDADSEEEAEIEYSSLEEIFAEPEMKEAFDSMFSLFDGSGIAVSLEVTGNEFAMTLKIEDSAILDQTNVEDLAATLDQQEAQYNAYAAQFDELLGESGATTVIVRYTDPDDNVLAEKSFKAE